MSSNGMIKLSGLWKSEGKDGESYYSGRLGGVRLLLFHNQYKSKDRDPDLVLYIAKIERKEQRDSDRDEILY